MNVSRVNCYTCINNCPPECELYDEATYIVLGTGKCKYTPVHNEDEAILQIYPDDDCIVSAILKSEQTKEVFEEIVSSYIRDNADIYWNIINGKLYLTVKIKQGSVK